MASLWFHNLICCNIQFRAIPKERINQMAQFTYMTPFSISAITIKVHNWPHGKMINQDNGSIIKQAAGK